MMDIPKLLCFFILLCISAIDIRWRKIPNCLLLLLLALGYVRICIGTSNMMWAVISLLLIGLPLLLIGINSNDILGGGDIKMCAAAAFCFGAEPVLLSIAGASILMLLAVKLTKQGAMPMAPFFAVCCMVFA